MIKKSVSQSLLTHISNKHTTFLGSIGGRQQDAWASTTVCVTARVGITAQAPTTKARKRGRGTHSPVRHALSLVATAQVAAFAPVAGRVGHLLLAPNNMALIVVPRAGGGLARRIAPAGYRAGR